MNTSFGIKYPFISHYSSIDVRGRERNITAQNYTIIKMRNRGVAGGIKLKTGIDSCITLGVQ